MNIKSTTINPFKWFSKKVILGGNDNNGFVILGTFAGSTFGIILGTVLGLVHYYTLNILGSIAVTIMGISMISIALTFISLFGSSDFDKEAWGKWFRIILYNIMVVSFVLYQFKGKSDNLHERVKTIDLVKTDIKGCTFNVRMTSDNLKYELCTDDDVNFKTYEKNPPAVYLVGHLTFGKNKAESLEYLDKHIVLK